MGDISSELVKADQRQRTSGSLEIEAGQGKKEDPFPGKETGRKNSRQTANGNARQNEGRELI